MGIHDVGEDIYECNLHAYELKKEIHH